MPRLSYADLRASMHRYVLELRIGSHVLYLAAMPGVIATDDGPIQVLDGLRQISWDDGAEMLTTEAPEGSIAVHLILPGIDLAALIAEGHDLGAARAELSRWVEGTPWERREVLMRAIVSEPLYGAAGEPVSFSLEAEIYQDRSVRPLPEHVVSGGDAGTWPDSPAPSQGRVYPIVFGRPGLIGSRQVAGSPGIVVDELAQDEDDTPLGMEILIAGDHGPPGQVLVMHESNPELWEFAAVWDTRDRKRTGEPVRTILLDSSGLATDTDGYWISWAGGASGMWDRRRERGMSHAGELLDWLLDQTTLRVDQGRMDAAIPFLEPFQLSGYINARVNVWHWIRAHLLPILPISIHTGPDGLYPIVWRWQATAEQAVEHLSADRLEVVRTAQVRYTDTSSLANELVLNWGLDARTRRYTQTSILTGRPTIRAPSDRYASSHIVRVSHSRYGLRSQDPMDTDIVYDAATAQAILAWRAAYHALPARMLEYEGGAPLLHLQLGDVVTLTDSELHLQRQVCIVTEIRDRADGRVGLVLRTIEDPARVA